MQVSKSKALVIAHYHEQGLLRGDTVKAIKVFADFFDEILLVSTHLLQSEQHKVSEYCEIVLRENVGYDFYSYRAGILLLLKRPEPIQLTLMNTSFLIFNPHKLLGNYFKKHCERLDQEFLGLTLSNEEFPHVQTYLFTISPEKWIEYPFICWWKDMEPIDERMQVIKNYELGLSDFMARSGVEVSSAFQYSPNARAKEGWHIFNPTHGAARELFEAYGVLKIETYRMNPHQIDLDFLFSNDAQDMVMTLKEGMHN